MSLLYIPLKKEYFERFSDGSKTVEYRKENKIFNTKRIYEGMKVKLSLGYTSVPSRVLFGIVKKVGKQFRDCKSWIECYGSSGFAIAITITLDGNKDYDIR